MDERDYIALNNSLNDCDELKKNNMEKLKELMSLCKCSLEISVNNHRDYYDTVESYLRDSKQQIEDDVFKEMIKRDTIIEITMFPDTTIGSYVVYHYDIEVAINTALSILKNK